MNFKPMLSDAQWKRIEKLLPANRRDRWVIGAILYLEFSGQSLRHVAELFGVSKTRLDEWRSAIEADLPGIMAALKLEPAGRSHGRVFYGNDPAAMAEISALRVGEFRQALRASRR